MEVLSRRSTPLLVSGVLAVALAQLGLVFSLEVNEKAPVGYLLLLALGFAAFASGSLGLWHTRWAAGQDAPSDVVTSSSAFHRFNILDSVNATLSILIGIMAVAALLIPLGAGAASGYMLLPWIVALAAFAVPFQPQLTSFVDRAQIWLREYWGDILAVVALMGAFIGLGLYDLQDWYYSAIGDEFLFFEHARHMTEEGLSRPFSQEGVYNHHPVMSTVYQAVVMWMFGADYLGWTFSALLSAAVAIPGIYVIGHTLSGRRAAILAAALFAASHFILAGTHIGNTVLNPLPVAAWAMALFVLGWRKDNPLLLYAAGVVVGLGFYSHYSGRAMLPVMFLFALTAASPRRLLALWPLAFGFALTVAPTFVVEQEQVFTRMFDQVVGGYSEAVTGSTSDRILNNIEINLPAFNYNSTVHSYVYGALMDPVSAVLAVLGIGFALGHIRRQSFRLLLIWFGVAAFMTGVLSPYPHVAITRLAFVFPPLALLAGLFAAQVGDVIQLRAAKAGHLVGEVAVPALMMCLLAVVLVLNLWQFWQVTPTVFPHRPEAVALGAFRSEYCGSDANGAVFVGQSIGEGSLMEKVLIAFDPDGPLPRRLNHENVSPDMEIAGHAPRCVVFLNPGEPEAHALQESLARRYPDGRSATFANPSGTTSVEIFAPSQ